MTSKISKFVTKWRQKFIHEIAKEVCMPTESKIGWFVTKGFEKRNSFLENGAVELLQIQPDDTVLEVGFGPGVGLRSAAEKISKDGKIYGIDYSEYMVTRAEKYCVLEVLEDKVEIHHCGVNNMPFPDNFFDKVFHCNSYYFWPDIQRSCREIHRVMKPGGLMVCTLWLDRLNQVHKLGALEFGNPDPVRYMSCLEMVGFKDVGMKYFPYKTDITYQGIFATKSEKDDLLKVDDVELEMQKFASEIRDYQRKVKQSQKKEKDKNTEVKKETKPDTK